MPILTGLAASYDNDQNGMIRPDMIAAAQVAAQLDEVIVFRSTGPWAKRWIELGHPTKNFHVKGKSSDWGPQAGCVPHDAKFSKRIDTSPDVAARTKANEHSMAEGWARKVHLRLSAGELHMQLTRREGAVTAVRREQLLADGGRLLWAGPHGGGTEYAFRATPAPDGSGFLIDVFDHPSAATANVFRLGDPKLGKQYGRRPLYVMASNEVGAGDKSITGDYDLFAVIPTWAAYGGGLGRDVVKPGIALRDGTTRAGKTFSAGVGMDNVLDPSLHTASDYNRMRYNAGRAATVGRGVQGPAARPATPLPPSPGRSEHADMGNITPRILRCINALNVAMGAVGDRAPLRRVHHNAESHRNAAFGALTRGDMEDTSKGGGGYGDGFPLTAFLPNPLRARFGGEGVCTLTTYADLAAFATALHQSGYYVPKNWAWHLPKAYEIARA